MRFTKRPLAIAAGLAAGLAPLAYPLFLRRRCLTWGARAEEVAMKLPGPSRLTPLSGVFGVIARRAAAGRSPRSREGCRAARGVVRD